MASRKMEACTLTDDGGLSGRTTAAEVALLRRLRFALGAHHLFYFDVTSLFVFAS
jgi:hypothetical protein